MKDRYVVEILWELVAVRRECERGFRRSAERTRSERVRKLLAAQARQCSEAARELGALIGSFGRDARQPHSVPRLHPVRTMRWSAREDCDLLEECEQGACCILQAYRNALDELLPEEVSAVLLQQLESAVAAHEQIRELAARQALRTPVAASLGAQASTH